MPTKHCAREVHRTRAWRGPEHVSVSDATQPHARAGGATGRCSRVRRVRAHFGADGETDLLLDVAAAQHAAAKVLVGKVGLERAGRVLDAAVRADGEREQRRVTRQPRITRLVVVVVSEDQPRDDQCAVGRAGLRGGGDGAADGGVAQLAREAAARGHKVMQQAHRLLLVAFARIHGAHAQPMRTCEEVGHVPLEGEGWMRSDGVEEREREDRRDVQARQAHRASFVRREVAQR
jgi:hypothetical protein